MVQLALGLIRFYQRFISPGLPASCRFYPTCSQYGYEAIARYGIIRGGLLTLRRVLRCHPFHPGGYDPVPLALDFRATQPGTENSVGGFH